MTLQTYQRHRASIELGKGRDNNNERLGGKKMMKIWLLAIEKGKKNNRQTADGFCFADMR